MSTFHHFTEIKAWQESRALVGEVYVLTAGGAIARDFTFRDQWRRAAISVMNNIAEGFARGTDAQFKHFLAIARGSFAETESMVFLAVDLGYLTSTDTDALSRRIGFTAALIAKLTTYLRSSDVREDHCTYQAQVTSGLPDFRTSGL
jgi:four helix bundle protein